jgi:hypothetical protein
MLLQSPENTSILIEKFLSIFMFPCTSRFPVMIPPVLSSFSPPVFSLFVNLSRKFIRKLPLLKYTKFSSVSVIAEI